MKKELLPREWFVVTLLVSIMFFMTCYQIFRSEKRVIPDGSAQTYLVEMINVDVSGRVFKPGLYTFKKGALLSDLLDVIDLEEDADISKLKLKQKLRNNQKVNIK